MGELKQAIPKENIEDVTPILAKEEEEKNSF